MNNTGEAYIVEGTRDPLFGAGILPHEIRRGDSTTGRNWMGHFLMKFRNKLLAQENSRKKTTKNITLLGDSNMKYLDCSKFTSKFNTLKLNCYSLDDAVGKAQQINSEVVMVHTGLNDLKQNSVDYCVDKTKELVKVLKAKNVRKCKIM